MTDFIIFEFFYKNWCTLFYFYFKMFFGYFFCVNMSFCFYPYCRLVNNFCYVRFFLYLLQKFYVFPFLNMTFRTGSLLQKVLISFYFWKICLSFTFLSSRRLDVLLFSIFLKEVRLLSTMVYLQMQICFFIYYDLYHLQTYLSFIKKISLGKNFNNW